ncbi:hypothetical protein TSOC_008306, partial [Tetrabaena socialis]
PPAAVARPSSTAAHGVSFVEPPKPGCGGDESDEGEAAALLAWSTEAVPRARHLPMSARQRQSLRVRAEQQPLSEPSFMREPQPMQRSMTTRPQTRSDYAEEEAAVLQLECKPEFKEAQKRSDHDPKDSRFTLLHFVAMLGHVTLGEAVLEPVEEHKRFARIARCLIRRHKEDLFVKDKYGCTPLQLAAACGNSKLVDELLAPYGMHTNGKALVEAGTLEGKYLNNQDAQMRFTALHGAVSRAQHETVVLLLRYGANPEVMDVTRKTAFKVAPSLEALQQLLQQLVKVENEVPTLVIVQLMAEVLEQEEAAAAKEAKAKAAATVGSAAASVTPPRHSVILVRATIQDFFAGLYANGEELYTIIVEYLMTAVRFNHYRLTELMVDLVLEGCLKVLQYDKEKPCWQWAEMLEPLVAAYPPAFHRLLSGLKEWSDEDVRGFVQVLVPIVPDDILTHQQSSVQPRHAGDALQTSMPHLTKAASGALTDGSRRVVDSTAARVKLYQHLVLGLKKGIGAEDAVMVAQAVDAR